MNYSLTNPGSEDTAAPDVSFKYDDERKIFDALIQENKEEGERVAQRRKDRKNRVSVTELRQKGTILSDETWVADRTIDKNIRRQMVTFVKYVTQSPDVLFFQDIEMPDADYSPLISWFSKVVRIGDWKKPWLQHIDGILLHGGGALEVMYNPDLPQQVELEHIRRENLIIPAKAREIQACSCVGRRYEFTKADFDIFAQKFGWNPTIVNAVKEIERNSSDFIICYKWYKRAPDTRQLHIMWTVDAKYNATDWLSMPMPYQNGIFMDSTQTNPLTGTQIPIRVPMPVDKIPIYFAIYQIDEDEVLLTSQGRAAIDGPTQEAIEHTLTGTVNAAIRFSKFYPHEEQQGNDFPSKEPPRSLKHGEIIKGNISVFQSTPPNAVALSVIQAMGVRNSSEAGDVDFAAMSRQDTAKRATEINTAVAQAEEVSSLTMELFSTHCKEIYMHWLLVLHSAIVGGSQVIPIPPDPKIAVMIDRAVKKTCLVSMAADVTVLQKEKRIKKYLQFYPLVAGTPYAQIMLDAILQEVFPDEFQMWQQQVGQVNMEKQALANILNTLTSVSSEQLPDDIRSLFKSLIRDISGVLGPNAVANSPQ